LFHYSDSTKPALKRFENASAGSVSQAAAEPTVVRIMAIVPPRSFLECLIVATPIPDMCSDWLSNGSAPHNGSGILEGFAHLRDLCFLVRFALFFQPRRSLRQPLPTLSRVRFPPKRLQRFLRGFVAATAHRLITAPAIECNGGWFEISWRNRIVARVMSGFVMKEEVRLQAAAAARIAESGKSDIRDAAKSGDVAELLSYFITRASCVNERGHSG
jgi:hypothetical protein